MNNFFQKGVAPILIVIGMAILVGVGLVAVNSDKIFKKNIQNYPQGVGEYKVKVLPVFFVPFDMSGPTEEQKQQFLRHLTITQGRYKEMLDNRDTFQVSPLVVYNSPNKLSDFRRSSDQGAAKITVELLKDLNYTKDNLPYVLLVVVINNQDRFPAGGGRSINGGHNNGGGIVLLSSFELDNKVNKEDASFQSTLQHELGHGFGLVHIDMYGYDMKTNNSIMSYNPTHHWNNFEPPTKQGVLIPEDIKALAENKLVFPHLYFDVSKDVPPGYNLKQIASLEPMALNTEWQGYQLLFDGVRVGHEPDWTSRQAIENLLVNKKKYPDKKVEGTYGSNNILIESVGYELYHNGERVGHEPNWILKQAVGNLRWNVQQYPNIEVVGVYNGQLMSE